MERRRLSLSGIGGNKRVKTLRLIFFVAMIALISGAGYVLGRAHIGSRTTAEGNADDGTPAKVFSSRAGTIIKIDDGHYHLLSNSILVMWGPGLHEVGPWLLDFRVDTEFGEPGYEPLPDWKPNLRYEDDSVSFTDVKGRVVKVKW
jgi:hypothetical protein